MKVVKV